jgi:hypothetical protein
MVKEEMNLRRGRALKDAEHERETVMVEWIDANPTICSIHGQRTQWKYAIGSML